ncbi:MAG TPA: phenylalanine--tRNA ligase subunit alpha [Candidatus Dormibacteraeota bacterium]|nr:phenylalanine--tRNA ligase subunit alpha [Candidatus Dormibacteraeota bacterium]
MTERLDALEAEAARAFESAKDPGSLEEVRVRLLGRKSELTGILRGLKDLSPEERAVIGARANRLRESWESRYKEALSGLASSNDVSGSAPAALHDVTLPGRAIPRGHEHILSQVLREVREIFHGMGFSLAEGPQVEDDGHNFGALNMPKGHPARAATDTFYLRPDILLRTHTSSVQIRVMEKQEPPVRIICPGRVYRNEAVDATHHFEFHQVEGLYVDENVTLGDLKGTLDRFLKSFFGPETEMRFSPSYFPFVEPGAQVEIRCFFCGGKGCQVCGPLSGGWLEVLGAGMVHPNVFRAVKYDPERWTGFAFGAGIERLVMLRHGVPDIRLFYENDVRFLHQF